MKLTELIEKRIDENVASYDLGTLESYKYLIEMIAIEYHNEQLILSGVSNRRELCEGKCGMSYCDDNGCLNKKEILGEPKDTSIVE